MQPRPWQRYLWTAVALLGFTGVGACEQIDFCIPSACMVAKSYAAIASGMLSIALMTYALVGTVRFRDKIRCTLNDTMVLMMLCDFGNAVNVVISSALMLQHSLKGFCDVSGYLTTSFGTGSMMFAFFFYLHAMLVLLRGENSIQHYMRVYLAVAVAVLGGGVLAMALLLERCPERGTVMAASETPWCMLPHAAQPTARHDSERMVIMRFFLMYVWWALNVGAGAACFYLLRQRRKGFQIGEHGTKVVLYRGVYFVFVTVAWCVFFTNRQLSVRHNHLSFVQAILHPMVGGVNALIFILCERLPARFRGEPAVAGLRDVVNSLSDIFEGAPLFHSDDYSAFGYSAVSLHKSKASPNASVVGKGKQLAPSAHVSEVTVLNASINQ
jgi:hypothetical protein